MHSKQTKIICTLSPEQCTPGFIQELVNNGMNVIRLNTAHQTIHDAEKIIAIVHSVSKNIGILVDTKGPEVRTCNLIKLLRVKRGDMVRITNTPSQPGDFQVNYDRFVEEIPKGSSILIDDGELELLVEDQTAGHLQCVVQNDGEIKNRKSLNVPSVYLQQPTLTEKDVQFIEWATQNNVDFIAHSFVRNQSDVLAIQKILDARKSNIKIIAKIENREGIKNLESILDAAYGIMVARGDLGIEIHAEEVPFVQKEIILSCIRRCKPVITATQMLHSMITNPRPTRAEVSDVANAVLDGTDALMLSGETAYGAFPVEAVRTMSDIAQTAETQKESMCTSAPSNETSSFEQSGHLAKAAVTCTTELPIQAIVTSTREGETALLCASHRGREPIFSLSENMQTVRRLSLSYGVYSD